MHKRLFLLFVMLLSSLQAQKYFHQYYTYCMHASNHPIVFHNIPKNASNFIKDYLFNQNELYSCYFRSNLHKRKDLKHVICVRNPLYRPISIYQEILKLRQDGPYNVTKKLRFYHMRHQLLKSFEMFLKEIEGNFYDQHLSHQFLVLAKKSLRLSDMDFVFLFENLNEDAAIFSKKYHTYQLPKSPLNSSSQVQKSELKKLIDDSPKIQQQIRKLWSQDFIFYEQAKKRRREILAHIN